MRRSSSSLSLLVKPWTARLSSRGMDENSGCRARRQTHMRAVSRAYADPREVAPQTGSGRGVPAPRRRPARPPHYRPSECGCARRRHVLPRASQLLSSAAASPSSQSRPGGSRLLLAQGGTPPCACWAGSERVPISRRAEHPPPTGESASTPALFASESDEFRKPAAERRSSFVLAEEAAAESRRRLIAISPAATLPGRRLTVLAAAAIPFRLRRLIGSPPCPRSGGTRSRRWRDTSSG